jgi:hypothetical protein
MQSDNIVIGIEADGFTIYVDDRHYRFSHNMDEFDYISLKSAIEHITSDTIKIELEEHY